MRSMTAQTAQSQASHSRLPGHHETLPEFVVTLKLYEG
jgi:hypothetical protein